jgi:hypothetical protein
MPRSHERFNTFRPSDAISVYAFFHFLHTYYKIHLIHPSLSTQYHQVKNLSFEAPGFEIFSILLHSLSLIPKFLSVLVICRVSSKCHHAKQCIGPLPYSGDSRLVHTPPVQNEAEVVVLTKFSMDPKFNGMYEITSFNFTVRASDTDETMTSYAEG